jgi:hypothetical protein
MIYDTNDEWDENMSKESTVKHQDIKELLTELRHYADDTNWMESDGSPIQDLYSDAPNHGFERARQAVERFVGLHPGFRST